MKFTTDVRIPKPDFSISHAHSGLTIGSCFTTYIGDTMKAQKFPLLVNPLGTVYNPISIAQSIEILVGNRTIESQDLFLEHGVWQSFYLHTSFSNTNKHTVLEQVRSVQSQCKETLASLEYVIISLGTSWIYTHTSQNIVVNNCHKQPARDFTRRRMTVSEIVQTLQSTITLLRNVSTPNVKIIFTLSPIRHTKDGIFGNNVSKAALLLAIDELLEMPHVYYFPAYEILLDELRDYRFYAQDMIHPSDVAVAYIYEKFSTSYFTSSTLHICNEIESIHKAIQHKAFNADSEEYRLFITQNIEACTHIMQQYPEIDLREELAVLKQRKDE